MTTKTSTKEKAPKKRPSNEMEVPVYNTEGKKSGSVTLPENVFGLHWNADLVHQVVTSMQANAREPWAHTRDRSEQRGGGRKPWRQKGTGRARHGSRRSPIWRAGGVTFGPRNEKSYKKKINKKSRAKALYTALSQKLRDGEIIFVDTFGFEAPKASQAKEILTNLSTVKGFEALTTKTKNTALISTSKSEITVKRSFSNFGNILVNEVRNLNPVDVLRYKYIVISNPSESIEQLTSRLEK